VDFKNTVVIMTSNLGSQQIQAAMSGGDALDESTKAAVTDVLRSHFRPEFLNRVDEVVIFEGLRREDTAQIVDIQLDRMRKLLTDKRLSLEVTDAARMLLAERGYDPVYGARPLKRTLQKLLQDPLALKVLKGEFRPGDTVKVDAGKDSLRFDEVARA